VKKLLALCVVGALALTLTGCPGGPGDTKPTAPVKTDTKLPPIDSKKGESNLGAPKETTVDATVTDVAGDKVTVKADGKDYTSDAATKIMVDGKESKAADVKKDMKGKATLKDGKVTAIDVKGAGAAPADKPVDATVTAVEGDKITIKAGDKDYTTDKDTKVMVDGKPGKPADVKKDMKGKATIKEGKVTELDVK